MFRRPQVASQQSIPSEQNGFYSAPKQAHGLDRLREILSNKIVLVSGFSVLILVGVIFFAPLPGSDSSSVQGRGDISAPKTVAGIIGEALGLSGSESKNTSTNTSKEDTNKDQTSTSVESKPGVQPDIFDKTDYTDDYVPPTESTDTKATSPNSSSSDTGSSQTTESINARPPVPRKDEIVNINYLHGYSYLRGVNAFTFFRQHRSSLSYDKLGEPQETYNFLAKKGHKLIRLGISWGRLQPNLNAGLDQNYLAAIDREIAKIAKAGMYVIFDIHNGGSHPNDTGDNTGLSKAKKLGAGISEAQLVRTWSLISDRYRADTRIIAYELFNEPWANDSTGVHATIDPAVYRSYTNSVVNNLRLKNDTHWVWIAGMVFSGNDNVSKTSGGDGDRSGSAWIKDPLKRTMYTQHFYAPTTGEWGKDYTAEYLASSDASVGNTLGKLRNFAEWCKTNGVRCSIGELGWPGRDNTQTTNCYHAQPTSQSAYKWNVNFGEKVYQIANTYKLDVTYFAAMSLTYPCEWRHIVAYAGPVYFDGKYFLTTTAINHGRSHNTVLEAPAYRSK